jgi:hypothetical protein
MSDARWREHPLPPDPVIEVYKKDVDRTLLVENLRLSVEERLRRLQDFVGELERMKARAPRARGPAPGVDGASGVIEAFKKDIDRGLLRNSLRLSVEERLRELMRFQSFIEEMRRGLRRQPS